MITALPLIGGDVMCVRFAAGTDSLLVLHQRAVDGTWSGLRDDPEALVSEFERRDAKQRAVLVHQARTRYIAGAIGTALALSDHVDTVRDSIQAEPNGKERRLRAQAGCAVLNVTLRNPALKRMLTPDQISALHRAKAALMGR